MVESEKLSVISYSTLAEEVSQRKLPGHNIVVTRKRQVIDPILPALDLYGEDVMK